MKYFSIIFLCFVFINFSSFSQKKAVKGYKIEGDYVVFTFDKRDYTEATDERTQKRLDFQDFDIKNVVVSGNFNLWSRDSWKMTKINSYIYELRKKITDFKDEFDWEFKFVINNSIWAEPSKDISNITPATEGSISYYTYNLKMYKAYPSKKGNVKFKLKGYKNAKKVIVTGSFNKWNQNLFEMERNENGWELILQMKPDKYEYRFIVDGQWMEDPSNPFKVPNEFGEYNSLIDINVSVEFFVRDFKNAEEVILAGSFNNWSTSSFKMRKVKNGWTYKMKLPSGKHHYKYIVDGKWKVDPSNPVREFDGHGNINSVKMVK
ncbi:glycogen-binding domain-containing protein [Tenacibaculum agarivorans]|uniref:glycogen-binding domain-containing protein n=1 Tax=Tenacibaculum agarivorans TaxID=1908389 RepID=UPI00094BC22E|nr:glycogen-binding domain-containing protein [Tenacibaculum agarivorans]